VGIGLQNVRDEAHYVGQQALDALKMDAPLDLKRDAVEKAGLAQLAHDEMTSHVTSCKTCSEIR
jgi:hypothetical protein